MPDGENGAGDAAGRCEVHESQRGSQTGILHADLDGHSAGLCLIETEAAGADMAEQHAAEVMQDDDSEDHKAVVEDGAAGEGNHASYGEDDDESREHRRDLRDFRDGLREENIEKDA